MSSSSKSFYSRVTPECPKFAKRSTMLNSIGVFFAIVSIILIIIALVYIYMDTTNADKIKQNKQISGGLIIATLFTVVVTALVGIWQIMVNKSLAECIQPAEKSNSM